MSLYVYITEECREDAREHSIEREVNIFKNKILNTQRITLFDNFPPPYLKKRFKRQQRLLAAERRIGDDIIIVFYRILIRGGKTYEAFLKSPKLYGDNNFAPLVSDDKLKKWLEEEKKEDPLPEKPSLTDSENTFIYGLSGKKDIFSDDYFIYETYTWVDSTQVPEIQNRLINIPQKLQEIIDNKDESGIIKLDDNYSIHYQLLIDKKVLCLYSVNSSSEELKNVNNDFDSIKRISAKSYPYLLTASEDLWIDIEKNNEANIALSPEEVDLLKSINNYDSESGFPIFINGRAGSGKSTILQFLFADYLKHYYSIEEISFKPPIFLTYSRSLVEKSRQNIEALINYHYENVDNQIKIDFSKISNSIRTFKEFLLNQIKTEKRSKLFPDLKYIDYPLFKKEWMENFGKDPQAIKNYGPDISWHIIRGFIKGVSIDGYLELEEYNELPEDERSVTIKTYKNVYEKVWNNWYKELCEIDNEDKKFWDDQDLVRYILDNDLAKAEYPGIFCDEAQDFTKIELELLLQINLFTNRKIDANALKRIPFAFAGDPFQTLNPTGFRWESIKTTYVEKFIYSLSPELRYGNPKLNYKELSFNYRSSENIVKLSNSIQLLRKYFFDYQNITPQKTWHIEDNPPLPLYYFTDELKSKEKIKEQVGLAIIIPCNNGEEKDFVKNDRFLREIIEVDETGVPQNVYSPMRAKGLEFKRVMLYCFSENTPKEINFNNDVEQLFIAENKEDKIPIEYYINQLYVGVSRAQKRLFILEKKETIAKLWRFAYDEGYQEDMLRYFKIDNEWKENLGNIVQGTIEGWDKEKEDINKIASKLEDEGKAKFDPYLLRQAALYYKNMEENDKNIECRAYANLYEDNYLKAGKLFYEINYYEKSLEAFWYVNNYSELSKFSKDTKTATLSNRLEVRISNLIVEPEEKSFATYNAFFEKLKRFFEENKTVTTLWEIPFNKLLETIIKSNLNEEGFKKTFHLINSFSEKINISDSLLGEIAYKGSLYEDAYNLFNNAGLENSLKFKKARANYLLNKFEQEFDNLNKDDLTFLGSYFYENKDYKNALKLFTYTNAPNKIREILEIFSKSLSKEELKSQIENYLKAEAFNHNWLNIIDLFLDNNKFKLKEINEVFREYNSYFLYIITKEIATDALLPSLENNTKEKISLFLKQNFIDKSPTNWYNNYFPEMIGCAIEKAGRDIDGLQFYEKVVKSKLFDEETKERAKRRWIKVKLKQAYREESRGLSDKSLKHKSEAEKELRNLNIEIENFNEPEFPLVSGFISKPIKTQKKGKTETKKIVKDDNKIAEENKASENVRFSIENYNINVLRNQKRINIDFIEEGYQVALFYEKRMCKSIDVNFDNTKKDENIFISEFMDVLFHSNRIEIKLKSVEIEVVIKME